MADRMAGPSARASHRAPGSRRAELTGWGRIAPSAAQLAEPADPGQVAELLAGAPGRGVIARGLGRSYNNAAQCGGGLVIGTTAMRRITSFDTSTGLVTCDAGVSLEQLMVAGLAAGWFVPVSPGTRQVTVGGAIAADVHGKNHHAAGSFAQHVPWFDLLLPDGRQCRVTPGGDPRLFWATAGGMGLTGIILAAAVQLTPVQTSRVRVDTVRTADIDETMAYLSATDDRYGYTVAWTDCLARGTSLGRSVITSGDFAAPGDLGPKDRRDPLAFRPGARVGAPRGFPSGLLNPVTVGLANEAWFRKAPRRREGEIQTVGAFFHPLDGIRNWNRVYGPAGFRQYQFVVPFGQDGVVRRALERISGARAPSFVTVLKRFGPADPGFLSFPLRAGRWRWTSRRARRAWPGCWTSSTTRYWTPAAGSTWPRTPGCGPRVFAGMYPRLEEFRKLRAELDPGGVFASDLSRRLEI